MIYTEKGKEQGSFIDFVEGVSSGELYHGRIV